MSKSEWKYTRIRDNAMTLRYVGNGSAKQVTVDKESVGGIRVDFSPRLPCDLVTNQSVEVDVTPANGHSIRNELLVHWNGTSSEVVPIT